MCWKSYYLQQKNEIECPVYTIHKNQLEINERSEYKTLSYKALEENIEGKQLFDIGLVSDFVDLTPKGKATKAKKGTSGTTSN